MKRFCDVSNGILSSIDLFSLKPSFRITFKNRDVYSSCTDQILTIMLFLSCIGCFIYFGLNMCFRKEPGTIISEKYQYSPAFLNITRDEFFLSFGNRSFDLICRRVAAITRNSLAISKSIFCILNRYSMY